MTKYHVVEEGNGQWCDPIEAASIDTAMKIVERDLHDTCPTDYDSDYEEGDDLPRVQVTISEVGGEETATREFSVGEPA